MLFYTEKIGNYTVIILLLWVNFLLSITGDEMVAAGKICVIQNAENGMLRFEML